MMNKAEYYHEANTEERCGGIHDCPLNNFMTDCKEEPNDKNGYCSAGERVHDTKIAIANMVHQWLRAILVV